MLISSICSYAAYIWYPICNKLYKRYGKYRYSLREICAISSLYDVIIEDLETECHSYSMEKQFPFDEFIIKQDIEYFLQTYIH